MSEAPNVLDTSIVWISNASDFVSKFGSKPLTGRHLTKVSTRKSTTAVKNATTVRLGSVKSSEKQLNIGADESHQSDQEIADADSEPNDPFDDLFDLSIDEPDANPETGANAPEPTTPEESTIEQETNAPEQLPALQEDVAQENPATGPNTPTPMETDIEPETGQDTDPDIQVPASPNVQNALPENSDVEGDPIDDWLNDNSGDESAQQEPPTSQPTPSIEPILPQIPEPPVEPQNPSGVVTGQPPVVPEETPVVNVVTVQPPNTRALGGWVGGIALEPVVEENEIVMPHFGLYGFGLEPIPQNPAVPNNLFNRNTDIVTEIPNEPPVTQTPQVSPGLEDFPPERMPFLPPAVLPAAAASLGELAFVFQHEISDHPTSSSFEFRPNQYFRVDRQTGNKRSRSSRFF